MSNKNPESSCLNGMYTIHFQRTLAELLEAGWGVRCAQAGFHHGVSEDSTFVTFVGDGICWRVRRDCLCQHCEPCGSSSTYSDNLLTRSRYKWKFYWRVLSKSLLNTVQ
eukprot:3941475-Rhodomonas_salina.4